MGSEPHGEKKYVTTEEDVLVFIPKWKWLSLKVGNFQVFAMNHIVSLIASVVLWGFVIVSLAAPDAFNPTFNTGKTWITQNFTWFYIGTQDVWLVFLLWLCFSSYGKIKLGKDDEKPRFGDMSWFCMLFCCGIGVGFFVFGVSEPLYYYRQPSLWKSWNYDYNFRKPGFFDDDQRANQAMFISFFHWGIHGWIPYIVPTLLLGLCAHRYGLPMCIRTCFFPLIGNQVFGLVGDVIDALSIACTTFGVCTSLGLGVMQMAAFYQYMELELSDNVVVLDDNASAWIIVAITCTACLSVILGLDNGLQNVSYVAVVLALLVAMPVFFADNTMYILNIFTQGIGYYLQNIMQIGFDCEAFQQLGFEFQGKDGSNHYWGSGYDQLQGKLASVDVTDFGAETSATLEIATYSPDCGPQANPCSTGLITGNIALLSATYLTSVGLSTLDAGRAYAFASTMSVSAGYTGDVPCGSGLNSTYYTNHTSQVMKGSLDFSGTPLPDDTPEFPLCPTTTYDKQGSWGVCSSYFYSCYAQQAYSDSTNPMFMDWWTVFYWGWWISWAPFFGVFVGTISRGRTIRETVMGAFIVPCLFIFFWFSVFGGLAIKMQRVAEAALQVKADWKYGTVDCASHYSGGEPSSPEAKALASLGYYMVTCRPITTQFFDILMPYQDLIPFLMPASFVALLLWFITSSDSGSFVDDMLASSGLSNPPVIQKIYWCWTEGICAIVLLLGGRSAALKALRSASICAGFVETFFLCYMCTALYRLVKFDAKDPGMLAAKKFNTQLLDFASGFQKVTTKYSTSTAVTYGAMPQLTAIVIALVCPGWGTYLAGKSVYSPMGSILLAGIVQLLWLAWFICQITEVAAEDMFAIAWTFYMLFVFCLTMMRSHLRGKYGIWGSFLEDFWICLTFYPFAVSQMQLQVQNDGEGMPGYFQDLEQLQEYFGASTKGITLTDGEAVTTATA